VKLHIRKGVIDMAANTKLTQAKNAKNDEFYTQMEDIEKEIQAYLNFDPNVFKGKTVLCPCDDPYESNFFKYFAQHFNVLRLKKLIATSTIASTQLTLFEDEPAEDKTTKNPHKIEITEIEIDENGENYNYWLNVENLLRNKKNVLTRLKGDSDFRSDEITKLRDEADVIVTNPPFSLFREFLAWIVEAGKQFLIIGNMNAITYKEIFPLIKENKMWLGATNFNTGMYFKVPDNFVYADSYKFEREKYGEKVNRVPGVCWFSNLEHGRRHQPIPFMTMEDNFRHSRHKEIRGKESYDKYDNYDAIEVPFFDAIPFDYDGVMGVPISFLDKYCPEQFEIMGMCENLDLYNLKTKTYTTAECQQAYFNKFAKKGTYDLNASGVINKNGLLEKVYQRILIKRKGPIQ